jgi:hypothetical protein
MSTAPDGPAHAVLRDDYWWTIWCDECDREIPPAHINEFAAHQFAKAHNNKAHPDV